jgi:hypothetical protein
MNKLWVVLVIVFIFLFWYGWGSNLSTLYQNSNTMETGQIVIRGLGVPILPIGAVMGYIGE